MELSAAFSALAGLSGVALASVPIAEWSRRRRAAKLETRRMTPFPTIGHSQKQLVLCSARHITACLAKVAVLRCDPAEPMSVTDLNVIVMRIDALFVRYGANPGDAVVLSRMAVVSLLLLHDAVKVTDVVRSERSILLIVSDVADAVADAYAYSALEEKS